jgi:HK97 family phage major capsid protein
MPTVQEEIKEAIDQIGRTFEEFKTENNKQIAKGVKDAIAEAKLDKLNQAIDDLTGKKEDLEKRLKSEGDMREELERKVNALRLGQQSDDAKAEAAALIDLNLQIKANAAARGLQAPSEIDLTGLRSYKSGFASYARKGEKALSPEEYKALSVGIDADGGFFVPPDTNGRIMTKVYELSPIRALASIQLLSGDRLEGINDLGEADAGWVGETATRSDTNTPQVGKYEIPVHEMYAQPKATQKLLDDSVVDIEAWLTGKVGDKFARLEGAAYCVGNGVGKPRGIASYATAATNDATRAWGTMEHVLSGASGAFLTSATQADCLISLIMACKTAYLQKARWLTTREVIGAIRKMKEATTNAYLWQPGLQQGQPSQLLGYPVAIAQDMPALAADSLSLAFGDFKAGYQIVDRLGVRVLRDPYTDKPYVKFYTIKRTGGAVVNFEAIKFIKFNS